MSSKRSVSTPMLPLKAPCDYIQESSSDNRWIEICLHTPVSGFNILFLDHFPRTDAPRKANL